MGFSLGPLLRKGWCEICVTLALEEAGRSYESRVIGVEERNTMLSAQASF